MFLTFFLQQSDPNHFDWYRSAPDPSEGTLEQSVYRLKTLLEISGGATDPGERLALHQSKYGLGDRRSLDQAILFSGVDTRRHLILENRCGNIDFVPFKEHPLGPEYIPEYDPVNEMFLGPRDPGSIYFNSSSNDGLNMWEDAASERQQRRQREIPQGLNIYSKLEEKDLVTNTGLSGQKLSSVAHIVHVSFGDGHGLHSQHEPDGSIIMVLLVLFLGILFNFFCRSKGKSSSISDEDSSYIKIV